jgi:hypothetical protein
MGEIKETVIEKSYPQERAVIPRKRRVIHRPECFCGVSLVCIPQMWGIVPVESQEWDM